MILVESDLNSNINKILRYLKYSSLPIVFFQVEIEFSFQFYLKNQIKDSLKVLENFLTFLEQLLYSLPWIECYD